MECDIPTLDGRARRPLAGPASWTKGRFALDQAGAEVSSLSDEAVRFCLMGAVYRCYRRKWLQAFDSLIKAIIEYTGQTSVGISSFNDHPGTTHADILAVVDMAGV